MLATATTESKLTGYKAKGFWGLVLVFFIFFFSSEWLQGVFAWFFKITDDTSSSKLGEIAALQQTHN